jgi:hypothetical protein
MTDDLQVHQVRRLCLSLGIAVLLLCLLAGCVVETRTSFVPTEASDRVEFFGFYVVGIEGTIGKISDGLVIFPALINPKIDSAMIDAIPRLVIDSACIEAECLGNEKSYCPTPYHYSDSDQPSGELSLQYDGSVTFTGFFFDCGDFVRKNCRDKEVAVTLYARSLDRRTGKVLASEVKTGSYLIKVKSHLHSAGDF